MIIKHPSYRVIRAAMAITLLGVLVACSDSDSAGEESRGVESSGEYTYLGDTKAIFETKCVYCHSDGGSAPFSLTDYAEIMLHRASIAYALESATMPPSCAVTITTHWVWRKALSLKWFLAFRQTPASPSLMWQPGRHKGQQMTACPHIGRRK